MPLPPLVGTEYWGTAAGGSTSVVSPTATIKKGDLVIAGMINGDSSITNVAITNSGTLLGWTDIATASAASNCYVRAWRAIAQEDGDRTVTISWTTGEPAAIWVYVVPASLYDARFPVPQAQVATGTGGNDVSRAVNPPIAGSMIWMLLGDWQGQGALNPNANCTRTQNYNLAVSITAAVFRPTTNPRTDVTAFTIGEVADATGETTAWLSFCIMPAIEDLTRHPITDRLDDLIEDGGFPAELVIGTW